MQLGLAPDGGHAPVPRADRRARRPWSGARKQASSESSPPAARPRPVARRCARAPARRALRRAARRRPPLHVFGGDASAAARAPEGYRSGQGAVDREVDTQSRAETVDRRIEERGQLGGRCDPAVELRQAAPRGARPGRCGPAARRDARIVRPGSAVQGPPDSLMEAVQRLWPDQDCLTSLADQGLLPSPPKAHRTGA